MLAPERQLVIDLSSNNPLPTDYAAMVAAGVAGIVVKLTESDDYFNEECQEIIAKSNEHALPSAGYHFLHPEVPVLSQLNWLHTHHQHQRRIFVDSELNSLGVQKVPTEPADWYGVLRATNHMLHAVNTLAASGLYSNPSFEEGMIGAPWNFPLWGADYGVSAYPGPCVMWQFTDAYQVDGIDEPVDASWFYGTRAELAAFFAGKPLT